MLKLLFCDKAMKNYYNLIIIMFNAVCSFYNTKNEQFKLYNIHAYTCELSSNYIF